LPRLLAEPLGKVRRTEDVGEHERHPCCLRSRPALGGRSQLPLGHLDVRPRAETSELLERGAKLEIGVLLIVDGAQGTGQECASPGDLVWNADVAPALGRRPELKDRRRWMS